VRKIVPLAVAFACALVVAGLSVAAGSASWSAPLTSGQEIPRQVAKDAAAHGQFTATLAGSKLKWKLTFAGLTGPATAAHIHLAAKGKSGNVVVALCGPCKSGQSGTATIPASVKSAFAKHLLYVNVHTGKNAAGEIRGQLGG